MKKKRVGKERRKTQSCLNEGTFMFCKNTAQEAELKARFSS